jgi:acyl-homoserine-lactone acylase
MRRLVAGAVLAVLLIVPSAAAARGRYSAEIRRTEGGMPHVKARDYGSLGFGYAYAYAEDQVCRFADILATVNAQRSRYFGPEASYGDLGGRTNNLASDFFYRRINDSGVVERLVRRRYPHGPGRDVRATVRGFAAGWNAYLRRTGRDNLPDPRCRGAASVKPMRPIDLYRRFYSQSENPSSAHYADQTRLYARERFLPLRFTERQIRSDPGYTRRRVTGRR